MNRLFLPFIFAFMLTGQLIAETLAHSTGEAVLNAFIATYAKADVAWKKDIRLNENPGQLEPGRQLGQSATAGYYSFIPKVWFDLTPDEQIRVLKDPRLKAFLISSRVASTHPASPTGESVFPIEGAAVVLRDPQAAPPATAGAAATPPPLAPTGADATPLVIKVTPNAVLNGQPVRVDVK